MPPAFSVTISILKKIIYVYSNISINIANIEPFRYNMRNEKNHYQNCLYERKSHERIVFLQAGNRVLLFKPNFCHSPFI